MQYIDNPFPPRVHLVSPEHAYMAGQIKTTNLEDLRSFQQSFPFDPAIVVELFKELAAEFPNPAAPPSDRIKLDYAFLRLLPRCYTPSRLPDWHAVMHFIITDMGAEYTVTVDGVAAKVRDGLQGEPTSVVRMDYETYRSVLRYEVIEDSKEATPAQLAEWEKQQEAMDVELSDDQLEAVAGGKGCGAEAGVAQACGSDGCGAAAGFGTACSSAACGAAAGLLTACGGDACAGAAGYGTACGGAACAGAAGVGTACGGAACVADACAAAACGAAACSAAACAAAACGADAGFGACAGNVCGANANSLVDVGPCLINVIPCCPFI